MYIMPYYNVLFILKRLKAVNLICQDSMVHVPVHIQLQCCMGVVTGKKCITVPTVWQIYRFIYTVRTD